uniref:ARAD1C02332p n=1 Tax=Blastobotrys adeninivorans TaxID=409370 RepID=A0A060SYM3_BLAAD
MDPHAFQQVKEACVKVAKHALVPNNQFDPKSSALVDDLTELRNRLSQLTGDPQATDANFGSYVFFPLSHLFSKDSIGDRASEQVLLILDFLFSQCWKESISAKTANDLHLIIVYLIADADDGNRSDDTKAAGAMALSSLYRAMASSGSVVEPPLEKSPIFARVITVLLQFTEQASSDGLRINSLTALESLFTYLVTSGDELAQVLPATVSTLSKLLSGKLGNVHFRALSRGLIVLEIVLSRTFRDSDLQSNNSSRFRTQSWLKASKEQVRMALAVFVGPLRSHQRLEVREKLNQLCIALLQQCSKSLDTCSSLFIDTLVFNMDPQAPSLAVEAESALTKSLASNDTLHSTFVTRISDWIESIPRALASADDSAPQFILSAILHGMKLVPSSTGLRELLIESLSNSLSELGPTSRAVQAMENLSIGDTLIKDNLQLVDRSSESSFGLLEDLGLDTGISVSTQRRLADLLKFIGRSGNDGDIYRDTLMEKSLSNVSAPVKAVHLWMAVCIFKGEIEDNEEDAFLKLEPSAERTPAAVNALSYCNTIMDEGSTMLNPTALDPQHLSLYATALQGVGLAAQVLKQDFKYELVDHIYTLVTYLGNPNTPLRRQAQNTIIKIATSCGYPDVRALLIDNADYLVDGISIKLKSLDISPQSPIILSSLIRLAGPGITKYLDDLVTVLFELLDNFHGYSSLTEGIFQVFSAIVDETHKGFATKLIADKDEFASARSKSHISTPSELIQLLKDSGDTLREDPDKLDFGSHNNRPFAESLQSHDKQRQDGEDVVEPEEETRSTEKQEEEKWTAPVPEQTYKLIKNMVGYGDTFLTHGSSKLRSNLIQLISGALPILSVSRKELLPVINSYWPVLVSRLNDSETFVVEETLETIAFTCQYGGDFMTKRVNDIFPKIRSLLPLNAEKLASTVRYPAYSVERRLSMAVIKCIAKILVHTPIANSQLFELVRYFAPILELKDTDVVDLRKAMEDINPDVVWLELTRLNSQSNELPTSKIAKLFPILV